MELILNDLKNMSYDVIRRESRRFNRKNDDETLGAYVRGVVDLQTELYNMMNKE